jgi:hypothetical protein
MTKISTHAAATPRLVNELLCERDASRALYTKRERDDECSATISRMNRASLTRRSLLGAAGAAVATSVVARADVPKSGMPDECEVRDIRVPGDWSRRFTLLVPKHLGPNERVPLLILLHGLGETGDERMGAFAWVERYGLGTAYDRLRRAPVARTTTRADWTDDRVRAINAELAVRPFRGLVVACPYTPDLPIGAPGVLDGFARWLTDVVAVRARAEAPVLDGVDHTMLGGCSLGGHFSLEMFIRRAEAFASWGGVQTAISVAAAPRYAERLAGAIARANAADGRTRGVFIETSSADPFRDANRALSRSLDARGVANDFRELPGPHDQPWLRESGALELLYWHDERPRIDPRVEPVLL